MISTLSWYLNPRLFITANGNEEETLTTGMTTEGESGRLGSTSDVDLNHTHYGIPILDLLAEEDGRLPVVDLHDMTARISLLQSLRFHMRNEQEMSKLGK